jgi:hypothetical protein
MYTQLALQLARTHGWRAVLARAGLKHRSLLLLTSWVPDWSYTSPVALNHLEPHRIRSQDPRRLVSDQRKLRLKLIKHPSQNKAWLLLDMVKSDPTSYLCFLTKSKLFTALYLRAAWGPPEELPSLVKGRLMKSDLSFPKEALYLVLDSHSKFSDSSQILREVTELKNNGSICLPVVSAIEAFPLSLDETEAWYALCSCPETAHTNCYSAYDKNVFQMQRSPPWPNKAPSLLESLIAEYTKLIRAAPVEEWIKSDEELWMLKFKSMPEEKRQSMGFELFAVNDVFWRLLVRRFALKEQIVDIM